MYLTASDIAPGEVRHLFCPDRRLRQEVTRNHRPRHRLNGDDSASCRQHSAAAQPAIFIPPETDHDETKQDAAHLAEIAASR